MTIPQLIVLFLGPSAVLAVIALTILSQSGSAAASGPR